MKKILVTLTAFFVVAAGRSQGIEYAKKELYYERYESAKETLLTLVKNEQDNPDVIYWLGEIYLQQGKIDSAAALYRNGALPSLQNEVTKKSPPLLYIGWAHVLLDSGLAELANSQMERVLDKTKYKNVDALWAVAKAHIDSKNGDLTRATELLNMAIKRDKKNAALYNLLADAYRKKIDGSNAVRNYDMALEADPGNAEAMYKKGKIYKTQNNEEIYLEQFMQSYASDSTYTPVLYELYQYYFYKDVINAQKYLDKYLAHADPDPQQAYLKADLYYVSRKYREAIEESQLIQEREGDSAQPRLYKMQAYSHAALGDSVTALAAVNRYFEKQDTAGYVARDFGLKAQLLERLSADSSEIVEWYKKALAVSTDDEEKVEFLTSLANIENAKGNDEREAAWRGQLYAIKKNPTNLDIYKWGMALYQSRNFEMADSVFAIYADKYPDQVHGYLFRARSNTFIDSTMELGSAVPHYKKLIEVAGKDEEKNKRLLLMAYEYLAAYEANVTKRYATSLEYFDKVLELDPGNEDAGKNTEILKKWIDEGKAAE
jgi:tetratricopeptide (TPR) repeat protein